MRDKDKKFLLGAMAVLLIIAGITTWFIMRDPGQDPNVASANSIDQNSDVFGGGGDALPMDSNRSKPDNSGADSGSSNGPDNLTPGPVDPNKHSPDPDPEQPNVVPDTEWEALSFDVVIHGKVSIKSDGRAAVGAKITTEISTQTDPWAAWRAERDAKPEETPAPRTEKPKGSVSGSTTTDGAGEYRMTLSITSHRPKETDANRKNGNLGTYELVFVTANLSGYAPAKSRTLVLIEGADEEVNLKLAVPAAVRGRIVDAISREGIAAATGQLSDADSWRDGGGQDYSFTTDENGYFSINPIPADSYILKAQASGYSDYEGWRDLGRIKLAGGEENDLGEVALMLSATFAGRVVDADTGQPVAGTTVDLRQPAEMNGRAYTSAPTGEDGRFSISGVSPGVYTAKARARDYAPTELAAQSVEPGGNLDAGDIKLGRGLALSGIVIGTDDKPVMGVTVNLYELALANTWLQQGQEISSSVTDEHGRFELRGASEGTFSLKAKAEGYASHIEKLKVTQAKADLKIRLSRGGTVVGRVLDSAGNAMIGANVRVTNHDSQGYGMMKSQPSMWWGLMFGEDAQGATSGEDGTFRIQNIPVGVYLLAAMHEGESLVTRDDIAIDNDAEVNVGDLRFAGRGSARITVTEDGVPVPDLGISLGEGMAWGGMSGHGATTDNSGTALIEDVPAGTWYIRTTRDEEAFDTDLSRRRIVIEGGRTAELTLELRPKDGVYLHGKLTLNGDAIFTDIMLLGLGNRADVMKTAKAQQGGYYEFVGLKPGSYVLHTRESDKTVTCKAALELKEDGDFPFDQDFKGYAVSGSVNTPESTPAQLSSVKVSIGHLVNERADFATWLKGSVDVTSDGKFRFDNVAPGTYVVSATLAGVGTATTQIVLGAEDQVGVTLSIVQNSGSIMLTVSKLNGTPVTGGMFGTIGLTLADGTPVNMGEFNGWFVVSEGAEQPIPTVEAGVYTVVVKASGYLQKLVNGVVVKKGEATAIEVELTAASELYLTLSNTEVTQAMLDAATVRYLNADGAEVACETNSFDGWGAPAAAPARATLIARYLSSQVTEVRVKVAGFAELLVPIKFAVGKKIEFEGSLIAE